ncbi:MAG: hypothetical protein ACRYG8_17510 [Janthinobacterium lividum]
MGQKLSTVALVLVALLPRPALAGDDAICQAVQHDVQAYLAKGASCPCPYSLTHDGHACGKRSAWAKMGSTAPRCHADETAARMATPSMTRRPELACSGEEVARPAPIEVGEMITAGLTGRERMPY